MSDISRVRAANGRTYTAHHTASRTAYIYVLGHRVYGIIRSARHINGGYCLPFDAHGKWAFLVAAVAIDRHEAGPEGAVGEPGVPAVTASV